MEIKNIRKAANRIKKAIKAKEKIILYGDADLDGATSVIVLHDSIKSLGGKVSAFYFPDREKEGYGLTKKGLNFLKKKAPALLILLDCGISNVEEVDLANKIGFEVMIIDHHEVVGKLPEAKIIVDPKQKDDKYPFKGLSGAGVAFKLSKIILGNKLTKELKRNLLELVALSTIADKMPRESENKIFIEEGLSYLKESWRPGIKAFLEIEEFNDCPSVNQKISKIISILNVREVNNTLPASFRLFFTSSLKEAKIIIKDLLKKTAKRRENIEKIITEVEKRIETKDEPIIFEGGNKFELTLISSVASTLCQKYLKPAFLYKKMAKESHGTVRAPKEVNSVSLMKKCSKLLMTFGGHAQASGFRLKNENLEKFKECLIKFSK